jgi:hypothetical protein
MTKHETRNTRGAWKHSNRVTKSGKTTIPFWMITCHSLDTFWFYNRMSEARLYKKIIKELKSGKSLQYCHR